MHLYRFIISTSKDHVSLWLPYVSDTGTLYPESCIFGQLFNIGALLRKSKPSKHVNVYFMLNFSNMKAQFHLLNFYIIHK